MINFGKYSEKVFFISFGSTSDGAGGFIPTETIESFTFARIYQSKGGNDIESLQLELPKTYVMGIQWRSGFEPNESMQVAYRSYFHKIVGVFLNDERNRREWIVTIQKTDKRYTQSPTNTLQAELQAQI